MPEVGPGLTPRMMKKAAEHYIKEELTLSEQRAIEKEDGRKERKLMEQALHKSSGASQSNGKSSKGERVAKSDEMDDSDLESENDEDFSDIEDEADTEDNDEEELPEENIKSIPKKVAAKAKVAIIIYS